jgi:hypothetical protein
MRMILKWILKKWFGKASNELLWLTIGRSERFCERGDEHPGP